MDWIPRSLTTATTRIENGTPLSLQDLTEISLFSVAPCLFFFSGFISKCFLVNFLIIQSQLRLACEGLASLTQLCTILVAFYVQTIPWRCAYISNRSGPWEDLYGRNFLIIFGALGLVVGSLQANRHNGNTLFATLTAGTELGAILSLIWLGTKYKLQWVPWIRFHSKLDEHHIGRGGWDSC